MIFRWSVVVRKSLYFYSKGDNLRISQIQTSCVMSDNKILATFKCFSRSTHKYRYFAEYVLHMRMRTDSVHSKDLQTNIARKVLNGKSWFKECVHVFIAECLFDASKAELMFNNHQLTLKSIQKLVSFLSLVSICHKFSLSIALATVSNWMVWSNKCQFSHYKPIETLS